MKRKYYKSSYQTTNRSDQDNTPLSNLILIDHNTTISTKEAAKKSFVTHKKFKSGRTMNKKSVRDLMSNEQVNSFLFPEIRTSYQKADASRITGFTSGTNEEIPSQLNDPTIEYYS